MWTGVVLADVFADDAAAELTLTFIPVILLLNSVEGVRYTKCTFRNLRVTEQ